MGAFLKGTPLPSRRMQAGIYDLVHEVVHLLERKHSEGFRRLMDRFLPRWQLYRDELNQAPLAHEEWAC